MIDLAKPMLGEDEVQAVRDVLLSGMLSQGPKVAELEQLFAEYTGSRHAVAVGNGTQALHASLLACGIGPGDEVITSPFSFISSSTTIVHCSAVPVFADIEPRTFNVDVAEVRKRISPRTKAVMPVHLFGLPAPIVELKELCDEKGLILIEDACQAHGASVNGKNVGTFGSAAAFSFYPTKNMTTGEGGMVTTDDDEIADRIRLLRHHGQKSRYEYAMVGYNYRMTEMAAAIGVCQMGKLPGWTERRIANARYLDKTLEDNDAITTPHVPKGYRHVYHQYTIRVQNRDSVRERLTGLDVASGVYYPKGLHQLEPLKKYATGPMPNTEKAASEVLSLPVHPALSKDELQKVASSTLKAVG
jgi:perosamine synthetase